MDYFSHYSFY